MPTNEHVQPGRVTPSDLEAVERGQRDIDRQVGVDRRVRPRRECRNANGGAETIVANRPDRVPGLDQRRVDALDLGCAQRRGGTGVEIFFDGVEREPDRTKWLLERGRDVRRAEQGSNAGNAAQRRVDGFDQRSPRWPRRSEIGELEWRAPSAPARSAARAAGSGGVRWARRLTTPTMPHIEL